MDKAIFEAVNSGHLNVLILIFGMMILKSWLQLNRTEIDTLSKSLKENTSELRGLSDSIIKLELNLEKALGLEPRLDKIEHRFEEIRDFKR